MLISSTNTIILLLFVILVSKVKYGGTITKKIMNVVDINYSMHLIELIIIRFFMTFFHLMMRIRVGGDTREAVKERTSHILNTALLPISEENKMKNSNEKNSRLARNGHSCQQAKSSR